MAHRIGDRVEDTTAVYSGTGNVTFAGAPPTARVSVDSLCTSNGDTIDLVMEGGSQWTYERFTRVSAGVYSRSATGFYRTSTGAQVSFTSGIKSIIGDIGAFFARSMPVFGGNFALINGRINPTVSSNDLTIAIKNNNNEDPSLGDPVFVVFRNATLATGDFTVLAITAAMSITMANGATLGTLASQRFVYHVVIFNDAGTLRLGLINANGEMALLDESTPRSSTADTTTSADNARTFYTAVAVASKAFRVIGFVEYTSGLAAAGTYASAPTTCHLVATPDVSVRVPAAYHDALGLNSSFINGTFDISQEYSATSINYATGSVSKYCFDGWKINKTGTMVFNVQQVASVFPGYINEFKLTVATAIVTLTTESAVLVQLIEGSRFAKYKWGTAAAVPVTIGFWIKPTNYSGNLIVRIDDNISVVSSPDATFAITAGVPQYCTFTFTPPATWGGSTTTGIGAAISCYIANPGTLNCVHSTSDVTEITGVTLTAGMDMPDPVNASRMSRNPTDELQTCMKYLETVANDAGTGYPNYAQGAFSATNTATVTSYFKVKKKTVPTLSISALADFTILSGGLGVATDPNAISLLYTNHECATFQATAAGTPFTVAQFAALAAKGGALAKLNFKCQM